MKKVIYALLILILLAILFFIIIFAFNPADLRSKLIGSILNSYLGSNIENYQPLDTNAAIDSTDRHPLLNEDQEKVLQSYGVDPAQLPTEITPDMQQCFIDKLGQDRAVQIIGGSEPTPTEIFKARECLAQ